MVGMIRGLQVAALAVGMMVSVGFGAAQDVPGSGVGPGPGQSSTAGQQPGPGSGPGSASGPVMGGAYAPVKLAVYEGWFGFYKHIAVGYNEHDAAVIKGQIQRAQGMGISGFVVDWMGDRNPFVDQTYAMMQKAAAENHFQVALMYDQANSDGSTETVLRELTRFHETFLAPGARGVQAYLTYQGRPVIFIFPYGNKTDWAQVRSAVDQWSTPPLLIRENRPGTGPGNLSQYFDGFYPWPNPGSGGWAPDGSNWGESYLRDFYKTMAAKFPDKIVVGTAWPQFDDSRANWTKNRHMSGRCGQTYQDTLNLWKQYYQRPIPFLLIATWNDYEEGTAVEAGMPACPQ